MSKALEIGDKAPDFSASRDGGETISLSDFTGTPVVLCFYPKDDTPGCTKETLEFTELTREFQSISAPVIGASRDTINKHEKFRDKHRLKVILVSDTDGSITESYGVWVEKSMYGRKYMGIERVTFLIGADGNIANIWRKVRVAGHASRVLDAIKSLA